LENDDVRVLEMTLPAGVSDIEHSHPSETVYFERGSQVRIHTPGGEPLELDIPDGHILWHEPWIHRVENTGPANLRAIIVESKR
jgi:hypothetical protein